MREGIELARGEAEPFAGVVLDGGEAEGVLAFLFEEDVGAAAEGAAAGGLLTGEAPEAAIERQRGVASSWGGGLEMLGKIAPDSSCCVSHPKRNLDE